MSRDPCHEFLSALCIEFSCRIPRLVGYLPILNIGIDLEACLGKLFAYLHDTLHRRLRNVFYRQAQENFSLDLFVYRCTLRRRSRQPNLLLSGWVDCSIILFSYLDSKAEYCCNNMDASGNTPICAFNYSTFQVPDSSILPGYALLSNYTTLANATSSTGSTSHNDHNVAIGVGVGLGVALGLIAIASIAWALRERRKLNRYRAETSQNLKTPVPYSESAHQQQAYSMTPMNVGAYGQLTQTYHNNQPTPAVLSEMENRGPVELDSRK